MNVLHVCANPKPIGESASKQLAAAFFTALASKNPDINVTNVDLYQNPPPFLNYDSYRGLWYPVFQPDYQLTDKEKKATDYSRTQCDLVRDADVLVVTTPMWNFSIPAVVKAWIDQILAPGGTFNWTEGSLKPLHHLRKIILLVASGGVYKEGDERDVLTPEIRAAFGFIGVDDIAVIWADGQNPIYFTDAEERKKMAVEAAQELAEEIVDLCQATEGTPPPATT